MTRCLRSTLPTAFLLAGALLPGTCLVACAQKSKADRRAQVQTLVGNPAPAFALPNLENHPHTLAEHRGRIVVLAFWGSWCAPCRAELPTLVKLQTELAPQGVDIVPIAVDDPEKAREYLAKKHLPLLTLLDDRSANVTVTSRYPPGAYPKTIVIDAAGTVTAAYLGRFSESELRSGIQSARH